MIEDKILSNKVLLWMTKNAPYYVLAYVADLHTNYYYLQIKIEKLTALIENELNIENLEVEDLNE